MTTAGLVPMLRLSHTPSGSPSVTEERIKVPLVTESITEHVEHVLSDIQCIYELYDKEVVDFLREHVSLLEVVREAAYHLRRIFGRDVRIRLCMFSDPDAGEKELFALVYVPADMSVEEAMQKLQRFDEEWFLDVQGVANGTFNVDIVFE